jgi:hypothetical protein
MSVLLAKVNGGSPLRELSIDLSHARMLTEGRGALVTCTPAVADMATEVAGLGVDVAGAGIDGGGPPEGPTDDPLNNEVTY